MSTAMPTLDDLGALRDRVLADVGSAQSVADVDDLRDGALGPASPIAEARRGLRDADPSERGALGKAISEIAVAIEEALGARGAELAAVERAAFLQQDRLDLTLPGRRPPRGAEHLVKQVWEEIVDIFVSIGFTVASGPHVETAHYNFDALNTPTAHPARLESDTLYVEYGDDPEGVLLRTQTSPVQARWMESHEPPVYIVVPGRTFRKDAVDATHTPVFHQMEGLAVDENITFADLKGALGYLIDQFFGPGSDLRFVPNFFPFTEPSAEMHFTCHRCDGSGCRVCGNTGWIELLGCGMVDPNVLEMAGYDSTKLSGWAFGVGIDRLALIRYDVPELRYFFDSDMRVLEQFG
jgi:phenylalanyl-tRNA synthetase alpha chain